MRRASGRVIDAFASPRVRHADFADTLRERIDLVILLFDENYVDGNAIAFNRHIDSRQRLCVMNRQTVMVTVSSCSASRYRRPRRRESGARVFRIENAALLLACDHGA